MKLATYRDGSRDGQLVVVSRDLATAHHASAIASRLQQVLDDWNFLSPQLEDLYTTLNQGKARHAFAFDPAMCMAPLPRPPARLVALACTDGLGRRAQAAGATLPESLRAEPLLRPAAGEPLLGACEDLPLADVAGDLDVEAGLVVVTGDLPAGAAPARALEAVRLLMLAGDWVLRAREAQEAARAAWGGGFVQSRPAAACSPVAVTPDELGPAWRDGQVHLALKVVCRGRRLGALDASAGRFHVGQLLAHAARSRPLAAGTLLGCGPLSHPDAAQGCASLADLRALEALAQGQPRTAWLAPGDDVRIEMAGADGHSVFGAIAQTVVEAA